jgi:hypothetical protein
MAATRAATFNDLPSDVLGVIFEKVQAAEMAKSDAAASCQRMVQLSSINKLWLYTSRRSWIGIEYGAHAVEAKDAQRRFNQFLAWLGKQVLDQRCAFFRITGAVDKPKGGLRFTDPKLVDRTLNAVANVKELSLRNLRFDVAKLEKKRFPLVTNLSLSGRNMGCTSAADELSWLYDVFPQLEKANLSYVGNFVM